MPAIRADCQPVSPKMHGRPRSRMDLILASEIATIAIATSHSEATARFAKVRVPVHELKLF